MPLTHYFINSSHNTRARGVARARDRRRAIRGPAGPSETRRPAASPRRASSTTADRDVERRPPPRASSGAGAPSSERAGTCRGTSWRRRARRTASRACCDWGRGGGVELEVSVSAGPLRHPRPDAGEPSTHRCRVVELDCYDFKQFSLKAGKRLPKVVVTHGGTGPSGDGVSWTSFKRTAPPFRRRENGLRVFERRRRQVRSARKSNSSA